MRAVIRRSATWRRVLHRAQIRPASCFASAHRIIRAVFFRAKLLTLANSVIEFRIFFVTCASGSACLRCLLAFPIFETSPMKSWRAKYRLLYRKNKNKKRRKIAASWRPVWWNLSFCSLHDYARLCWEFCKIAINRSEYAVYLPWTALNFGRSVLIAGSTKLTQEHSEYSPIKCS